MSLPTVDGHHHTVRVVEMGAPVWGDIVAELTNIANLCDLLDGTKDRAARVRALREEFIAQTRAIPVERWLTLAGHLDDANTAPNYGALFTPEPAPVDDTVVFGPVLYGWRP